MGLPAPTDTINRASQNVVAGVAAGGVAGAIQSAWLQSPGQGGGRFAQASLFFGRWRRAALVFGGVGATFAIAESATEEFTGGRGPVAAGIGGLFAGSVLGLPAKSARACAGGALLLGSAAFLCELL